MTGRRSARAYLAGAGSAGGRGAGVAAAWLRGPQVDVWWCVRAPLVRTLQFSARVATLSRVDVGSTVTGRVARCA
jgi:HlyD family secretion protein